MHKILVFFNLLYIQKYYRCHQILLQHAYSTHGLMYNEVKGRNGEIMFETNHGTLAQHYENYISGQPCLSNPSATIYVWAKALQRRAIVDHN